MITRPARVASELSSLAAKAMRRLSLYAKLAWYRLLGAFGHDDFVRFIVLTRSRTGSNLLLSFLNSHPGVFSEGEIFATLGGSDPIARLRSVYAKQPRRVRAKGFKIFYYHPLDAEAAELWRQLERRTEIRVIHLTRDNILRTLLSRKIAGLQDKWTATRFDRAAAESRRVEFTASELEEGFRQTRQWESDAEARFRTHPILRVSYEELTRDPLANYARLLAFLDLPGGQPSTGLQRQNPESLRSLITNYDEMKSTFAGSDWEAYFEE